MSDTRWTSEDEAREARLGELFAATRDEPDEATLAALARTARTVGERRARPGWTGRPIWMWLAGGVGLAGATAAALVVATSGQPAPSGATGNGVDPVAIEGGEGADDPSMAPASALAPDDDEAIDGAAGLVWFPVAAPDATPDEVAELADAYVATLDDQQP